MTFYQSVFGGQLDVMTFADQGGMGVPDSESGQLDALVAVGLGLRAADGC